MMEVEKPWEFKDEVDIMEAEEEDTAGALQTREIKKKIAELDLGLNTTNGEAAAAEEEEEDQKQTVFLDPTHVSDDVTIASAEQEVTEASDEKENAHETSIAEGKELEEQKNVNAEETNHNSSNGTSENGLHSNGVHEASSSTETVTATDEEAGIRLITTITKSANSMANWSGALDIPKSITNRTEVHEIEVEKDEHATKGKVDVEEYDLEKILDEQETHDLYCPNCKSCITRRVILKKRKRTVRQATRDEPPKKTQLEQTPVNAAQQPAAVEPDQESPNVFRCLSCFAFFIPTGCRFNIFRIFERRDVNQVQVQHSSAPHEMSDNCGSWLLSCFQTVDSPKKSADAGPSNEPLISGSQSTNDQISLVEDNTSSVHSHATIGKVEQLEKPLPSGSSSLVQTSTATNEESKQTFSESHGTTSSSVTVHTTSSTTTQTSSWQKETGVVHKGERHMVSGEPDVGRQEPIPFSKHVGDAVTDAAHTNRKDGIQESTTIASESTSFFSPEFFTSALKFPAPSPTNVFSEVSNLMGEKPKPTSDIPQPVQSEAPPHVALPIPGDTGRVPVPAPRDEWDVLKSIVYGGLVESITSLSVVSAAAASGAKTLDIFILGIANLIGGLPIIFHNIADLRNLGDATGDNERVGQYWLQLGRRSKYQLHMFMAMLSYILFGLLPPVVYGLSFRKDDNRENKMMVVAAASLGCVALLAIGKAHVKRPRTYFTTVLYYLSIGLSGSGLSYVAGVLITRLLAHFGLIDQGGSAPTSAPAPPSLLFPDARGAGATAWASY